MADNQKWWQDHASRQKIVEIIMGEDFSPDMMRQLAGIIQIGVYETRGTWTYFLDAVSIYAKIMYCNACFSSSTIQNSVEKFKKHGKVLDLKVIPHYAELVSSLAKALDAIGFSTKEDVESILPVLQVAVIADIQKNEVALHRISLQEGFKPRDEVRELEHCVLEQVPANALWNQIDSKLNEMM